MNPLHLVPAVAFALFAAACSSAEPDISSVSQGAQASAGYGYEFIPDRVAQPAAPAQVPARVEGRLAPELIRDVVRGGFGPMATCAASGELTLHFTLHEDGSITDARADGPGSGEAATVCVIDALRGLRFPASSGGVASVVYPLRF